MLVEVSWAGTSSLSASPQPLEGRMDDPIHLALHRLIGRLGELVREDKELRSVLIMLGEALAKPDEVDDTLAREPTADDAFPDSPPVEPCERVPEPRAEEPVRAPLPELTLGRTTSAAPRIDVPSPFQSEEVVDDDLERIAARCRLKAEGLRWAWDRRRQFDAGGQSTIDAVAMDREIIERARALDCQLWMNTPHYRPPVDPGPLKETADCFETVAAAVECLQGLLRASEVDDKLFRPALELLAEAQSGLRVAIERLDGRKDPDQFAVYSWLRNVAYREQIYLPRFMTLERPADPSGHTFVLQRIQRLNADRRDVHRQDRERKSLLGKLRYHARRARDEVADEHDWSKINETLDRLVAGGEPPSSVEIREEMLPIVDRLPDLDETSRGLSLVLREIDAFLATRRPTTEDQAEADSQDAPTDDVAEVAHLLEGKSVVLIGGACRPGSERALREAFRLKELIWIETREHESIERFKPAVSRPDVALVILAIRWSSHAFADIKPYCDLFAKPLLRLPRGYNPNQVAREILDQCSERLRETPEGINN